MGKQNYHSASTDYYQQQRFCRRAITSSVRNPLLGPNWFISLSRLTDSDSRYSYSWQFQFHFITISVLIMMSAISKHCLALTFVFIAKCYSTLFNRGTDILSLCRPASTSYGNSSVDRVKSESESSPSPSQIDRVIGQRFVNDENTGNHTTILLIAFWIHVYLSDLYEDQEALQVGIRR